MSIIYFAQGAAFEIKTLSGIMIGDREPSFLWLVVSLILFAAGIVWVLDAFGSRVTLSEETIAVCGLRGRKSLPLNVIRGRRTYMFKLDPNSAGSTTYLKVVPVDDRLPVIDFLRDYNFDEAFYAWFNGLPDLDAMDKERKPNNFGLV